jgi:hypothetical protein
MSDFFEHFADLAVASLVKCDLKPRIIGLFDDPNLCRSGAHAVIWIAFFGD